MDFQVFGERLSVTVLEQDDRLKLLTGRRQTQLLLDAGEGQVKQHSHWEGALYQDPIDTPSQRTPAHLTLVPYFLWANRDPGRMQVWFETTESHF